MRARVEHAFGRMKNWKILRDYRLEGDDVHHAMLRIGRLHNLTLAGQVHRSTAGEPCLIQFEDHYGKSFR